MRQLASIQKITNLLPIPKADNLELASILGWKVVVKKGEFKIGDLVVYCEIDTVLPDKPDFDFLRNKNFRIKTVKLRGEISQGICFPTSILPLGFDVVEGKECTEEIGASKYEPPLPACLNGKVKGRFPSFIIKTDETRVQVQQDKLDYYKGMECYISEKLDGSSVTYYFNRGEFGVCTRNIELLEDETNFLWQFANDNELKSKLESFGYNIAIQGELIGEGIQSNKLNIKGKTVRFFSVFDIDKYSYYDFDNFKYLFNKFDLSIVPIISTDYKLSNNIDDIIEMATIKSLILDTVWAEGIVIRPLAERNDSNNRLSIKAINPKFLLKHNN